MHELPASSSTPTEPSDVEAAQTIRGLVQDGQRDGWTDENTALLWNRRQHPTKHPNLETADLHITPPGSADRTSYLPDEDLTRSFIGSNALEIAAVANAKSFLSQRVVQKIVNGIWSGDIVFWESLGVHSKKKARIYNKKYVEHLKLSFIRVPQQSVLWQLLRHSPLIARVLGFDFPQAQQERIKLPLRTRLVY